MRHVWVVLVLSCMIFGCEPKPQAVKSRAVQEQVLAEQMQAEASTPARGLKRKIAIGRFTNETNYGRALLSDAEYGKIGRQASDMLSSRLVRCEKFLVYEKPDLAEPTPMMWRADIQVRTDPATGQNSGLPVSDSFHDYVENNGLAGVDTLIVGAVTEFGRSEHGKSGFMSSKKIQTARAKVEVRLIDVKFGQAYFSASGVGEATTETGEVAGFGHQASYDATLNDRAMGAAISDMITDLISRLEQRPWRCAVVKLDGDTVYIGGGERQGVKTGDRLVLMKYGEKVANPQTGRTMMLPATPVGELEVLSLFGEDEFTEGALCRLVSGAAVGNATTDLFVGERK